MKKKVVILISGRGSNMEAIVHTARREAWDVEVAAVISNRPEAAGLAFAKAQGISTVALDHKAYPTREAFDAALMDAIDAHAPDAVVLAGFMRILTPGFTEHYAGRLLNIHPSLLPAFPGLHTHRRALEAGCQLAGATVHLVTAELDHGPILAQAMVPVLAGDDEARLAQRVLSLEHQMYPRALAWFLAGELRQEGGRMQHRDGAAQLFT
ncbi:phosphoribosylglycinamide formyltransferase-1 [Inhella inkyongensis]|uniref:Phosphoribosylglycinamide formyltransferase n=1 Tax=Inhella inkyongensis TaxID=392593 RepID=A0A840SBN5_9BURK|nr:phosphoribosylglycinamide formyltransferase [Inhella inkyongensis]MBB5206416.1 phosphoribosylglycinamide formyltransferase-1 [Inhella inkyongensis]